MAHKLWVAASSLIAASSLASASSPERPSTAAPAGTADTRYCLRVEPVIGSLIVTVQCWTREEWAAKEVDLDKEWAKEGVAIINEGVRQPVKG